MVRRMGRRCVLLLTIALLVPAIAVPLPARGEFPRPVVVGGTDRQPYLIRFDRVSAQAWPLDPATLVDVGERVAIELPEIQYYDWWCRAADGATVATDDGEAIVVRGSATLAVRHRVPLVRREWEPYSCALSDDGSRLVVTLVADRQLSATPLRWLTYDLGTGALVSDIAGTHAGALEYWIDPDGRTLYHLQWEYPARPGESPVPAAYPAQPFDAPKYPTLAAYDLDAGRVRARLALLDVVAGGWFADQVDGGQAPVMYSPAGALLPDGKRFVVVHVDREALTLIDTATMTVERTVDLARPTALAGRLLGLLPLAPADTAAAASEGAMLQVAVHPDGRHLYVTGTAWDSGADGYRSRGLGLRLIDLERGVIEAELPEGIEVHQLAVSADGRSLYVVGPRPSDADGEPVAVPFEIRRLDAATLATLATRNVEPGTTLELIPTEVLAVVEAPPVAA